MKAQRGFSLMELMIGIAIVGILAAVAYPSYTKSVIKANRGNAKAFLLEVAQREQQYLLDQRSYATKAQLTTAGVSPQAEFTRSYDWNVVPGTGTVPTFIATATPKSGTRQANDGTLQITETGAKTPVDKW